MQPLDEKTDMLRRFAAKLYHTYHINESIFFLKEQGNKLLGLRDKTHMTEILLSLAETSLVSVWVCSSSFIFAEMITLHRIMVIMTMRFSAARQRPDTAQKQAMWKAVSRLSSPYALSKLQVRTHQKSIRLLRFWIKRYRRYVQAILSRVTSHKGIKAYSSGSLELQSELFFVYGKALYQAGKRV